MPAPQRAARAAAATDTAALRTGTGCAATRTQGGIAVELAEVLTAQHRDEPWQITLEAVDGVGLGHPGHLEIQRQGPRRYAEPHTTAMARVEPCDFLGHERGGAKREQ